MAIPVVDNDSVISLWIEGREARNHKNTLKAIGGDLFSYNLKIGRRTEGGQCVVVDYTAGSGGLSFANHILSRRTRQASS